MRDDYTKFRNDVTVGRAGADRPARTVAVTKDALLHHFALQFSRTVVVDRKVRIDPALLESALNLVYALLDDDFPTPQVSMGSDGSVAVEWLVNGESLMIHLVSTSEISLWADDARGRELFAYDLNRNWTGSSDAIVAGRAFLRRLGESVVNRLPLGV